MAVLRYLVVAAALYAAAAPGGGDDVPAVADAPAAPPAPADWLASLLFARRSLETIWAAGLRRHVSERARGVLLETMAYYDGSFEVLEASVTDAYPFLGTAAFGFDGAAGRPRLDATSFVGAEAARADFEFAPFGSMVADEIHRSLPVAQRDVWTFDLGAWLLGFSVTAERLKAFFTSQDVPGTLKVRLLTGEDGQISGMAFVQCETAEALYACVALHHAQIDGRRINVERSAGGGREAKKGKLAEHRAHQSKKVEETVDRVLEEFVASGQLRRDEVDDGVRRLLQRRSGRVAHAALTEYASLVGRDKFENPPAYLTKIICRVSQEENPFENPTSQRRAGGDADAPPTTAKERRAAKRAALQAPAPELLSLNRDDARADEAQLTAKERQRGHGAQEAAPAEEAAAEAPAAEAPAAEAPADEAPAADEPQLTAKERAEARAWRAGGGAGARGARRPRGGPGGRGAAASAQPRRPLESGGCCGAREFMKLHAFAADYAVAVVDNDFDVDDVERLRPIFDCAAAGHVITTRGAHSAMNGAFAAVPPAPGRGAPRGALDGHRAAPGARSSPPTPTDASLAGTGGATLLADEEWMELDASDKPVVNIRNLTFAYETGGRKNINGLNCVIPPNAKVILVGANGAGKSTLLRILTGVIYLGLEHDEFDINGNATPHDQANGAYLGGVWKRRAAGFEGIEPFSMDIAARDMMKKWQAENLERRDELVRVLGINLDWRMHECSGGQRKKADVWATHVAFMQLDKVLSPIHALATYAPYREILARTGADRAFCPIDFFTDDNQCLTDVIMASQAAEKEADAGEAARDEEEQRLRGGPPRAIAIDDMDEHRRSAARPKRAEAEEAQRVVA
ncbi:hypothetical protein JL720_2782 [Aureococcus anophagefferens]|nr:hypothetical protein JL720_2782 [Aureococcus anophagefferens]